MGLTNATGQLMRWRLRIREFDFETEHRPRLKHLAHDALSRVDSNGHDTTTLDDDVPVFTVEAEISDQGLKTLRIFCNDEADAETIRDRDVNKHCRDDRQSVSKHSK